MRGPPNSIELNLHRSPFIFISLHVPSFFIVLHFIVLCHFFVLFPFFLIFCCLFLFLLFFSFLPCGRFS